MTTTYRAALNKKFGKGASVTKTKSNVPSVAPSEPASEIPPLRRSDRTHDTSRSRKEGEVKEEEEEEEESEEEEEEQEEKENVFPCPCGFKCKSSRGLKSHQRSCLANRP
jgi:hypothetical protein